MPFSDVTDGDSFGLLGATWSPVPAPAKRSGRAVLALQIVLVAGLTFFATVAALGGPGELARIGSFLRSGARPPTVADAAAPPSVQGTDVYFTPFSPGARDAVPPPAPPDSDPDRASIRIFTPRPGSIASGGPTRLCYAVSGALRARVEPGIGEVPPASTLTCIRVTPARTTTYALDVYGRDGYPVRQQLVIVVR